MQTRLISANPAARPVRAPWLALALLLVPVLPAHAFTLNFTAPATAQGERRADLTSYRLPTGPFAGDAVPAQLTEGSFQQTAWRVDWAGRSTLELLSPLRDQIAAAGWDTLYECETQACGGFDFRYGIEVLPEPEMHVDLGDYRFLAATRRGKHGPEYLSLLVSRSADQGFVQLTLVGTEAPPDLTASTKSPEATLAAQTLPTGSIPATGLQSSLSAGQPVVLEDLSFASGMAALSPGDYASLRDLADWLAANPDAGVTLVGHTDASGSVDANTALSQKRADAVRDVLLAAYGVAAERITAKGVGPAAPRASDATPEGRLKNRRVEVLPTPTR